MEERCRQEVIELHQFFQDWFNGNLATTKAYFARLTDVLGAEFVIVGPDGRLTERATLITGLRQAYGSRNDFKIWIENFRFHSYRGSMVVVTYEEWQQAGDGSIAARISTAVFQEKVGTPNGVMWLHVHETWLARE